MNLKCFNLEQDPMCWVAELTMRTVLFYNFKDFKVFEFAVRFCIACTSPYPSKIKDILKTLHVHLMLFFNSQKS